MSKIVNLQEFREKIDVVRQQEINEMELMGLLNQHSVVEQRSAGGAFAVPLEDGSLRIALTVPPGIDPKDFFMAHYPQFLDALKDS